MTRRRWLLVAAVVGVAALFAGRWLAVETAERLWAAALGPAAAAVQGDARALARLVRLAVFVVAAVWGVGNLYIVYRAIGSVQVPRRLGDLEIVEAIPQRALLAAAVLAGLLLAFVLSLGTDDWWLRGVLAHAGVTFGVTDPVLHRDLGYYVADLPLALALEKAALLATVMLAVLCGLLYYGIGSIRLADGKLLTSSHARSHLGPLVSLTALVLAWGASLEGPIWVAGARSPASIGASALDTVLAASWAMVVVASGTAAISLLWSWWGRHRLLSVAWGALLATWIVARVIAPTAGGGGGEGGGGGGGGQTARVDPYDADREQFTRVAYDLGDVDERPLGGAVDPTLPAVRNALSVLPLWDPARVAGAARAAGWKGAVSTTSLLAVSDGGRARAAWLLSLNSAADPAAIAFAFEHPGSPSLEFRSGEALPPVRVAAGLGTKASGDAVMLDAGDPASQFAVPLERWWHRVALAWTLQSAELVRRPPPGSRLLWHRDVRERIARLAPFAWFGAPMPIVTDGRLVWVAHGYATSATFPLAPPVPWEGGQVRYLHAGFLATVDAHTGETRFYLAPRADSVSRAWARAFAPLVLPNDSLPAGLRDGPVPYPSEAFRAQAAALGRLHASAASGGEEGRGADSQWRPLKPDPYQLLGDDGSGRVDVWIAQAFITGNPARLTAVAAATNQPSGPRFRLWLTGDPNPLGPPVVGAQQTAPGVQRVWVVLGGGGRHR